MNYKFRHIYIHTTARNDKITQRILQHYPDTPITIFKDGDKNSTRLANLSLSEGKRTLLLTHFKGNFLKPCPGTAASYRCCNYLVINETTNCPIDCSYCILQTYINNPAITIYTNIAKINSELKTVSKLNPDRILRIGTGELTDSLALDPVTGISEKLIKQIRQLPNILLELKTKTDHIQHLLDLDPRCILLSWSVNPIKRVKSDEKQSTPLEKRLKAAQKAQQKGFLIGLHFDPILYDQDWSQSYRELIEQIAAYLDGSRIGWISLGSFRYPSPLKEIIRERFPRSDILAGEQISGLDGKMRYIKPVRFDMYRQIVRQLREKFGDVFIYFCMESEDIWKNILNESPKNNLEVDWLFANHLHKKFPELRFPKPKREIYHHPIRWK
jgi:spore photoproduct lyase